MEKEKWRDLISKIGQVESDRLILSSWKGSHKEAVRIQELACDPDVGGPAGWPPHTDVGMSQKVLDEIFLPEGAFGIYLKSQKKAIGSISLFPDRRRDGVYAAELGYWLGKDYWRKGYMTEAGRALCKAAFEKLGFVIIGAQTSPVNKASQGVLKNIGFQYEGCERKSYKIYTGQDRDCQVWSLLPEELKLAGPIEM